MLRLLAELGQGAGADYVAGLAGALECVVVLRGHDLVAAAGARDLHGSRPRLAGRAYGVGVHAHPVADGARGGATEAQGEAYRALGLTRLHEDRCVDAAAADGERDDVAVVDA